MKGNNKNTTFINVEFIDTGEKVDAYIDTGATLCIGNKSLFPKWSTLVKPIMVRIADNSIIAITKVVKMKVILIRGYKFTVPTIYQQQTGLPLIIGNNFLKLYNLFCQY